MDKKTVVVVGCGDIGTKLGEQLAARGWRVIGLRRSIDRLPSSIEGLAMDITDAASLEQLRDIAPDYLVMTLTPLAFTEAGYDAVFRDGLCTLLKVIDSSRLQRLLFVSSTSVYHQNDGGWVDEDSDTEPQSFSGRAVLAAEQQLVASELPVTVVRFGGIYGPGRHRLIERVRAGRCAPSDPVQYSNRIHRDDCVGVLRYLIDCVERGVELADCYLAVDNTPTPLAEVQAWLAAEMGFEHRCEESSAQRAGSKRCSNRRLRELGYAFIYPDFRDGYRAVLAAAATEGR